MKISDSNPIQMWMSGRTPYNSDVIPYIQKKWFFQRLRSSSTFKHDISTDGPPAPTWNATTPYDTGDFVYSPASGIRYQSLDDANTGNDPSIPFSGLSFGIGPGWRLADGIFGTAIAWDVGRTYNAGERVISGASGWSPFIYESIGDGNTGNDPELTLGADWQIVIFEPLLYGLQVYNTQGVLLEEFDYERLVIGSNHQFVSFDMASYPDLANKLVRFFLMPRTIAPAFQIPEHWDNIEGAWDLKAGGIFQMDSYDGSTIRSRQAIVRNSIHYDTLYGKAGQAFTVRYRVQVNGITGGSVTAYFYAADSSGVDVSDRSYRVTTNSGPVVLTPTFTADGEWIITETIRLREDSAKLIVILTGNAVVNTPQIDIDQYQTQISEPPDQADDVIAQSDCVDVRDSFPAEVEIEFSNKFDFDDKGYTLRPILYALLLQAWFWEADRVTTTEDLPQTSGIILSLRSESLGKRMLRTAPMPDYMHDKICKILQHGFIRIDGVEYKLDASDTYNRARIDRSTVYPATVNLSVKDGVLVNLGGDVTLSGRRWTDAFTPEFT